MFSIIISALHVSGGLSAHHQEFIKLYMQPWVLSCFPAVCMTIPKAAHTVLKAPDDGRKDRPKHVER
jgi:hypothetical protein